MSSPDLKPWPISQACRDYSAILGFDPDHPEHLIRTPNLEAEFVLPRSTGSPGTLRRTLNKLAGLLCGTVIIIAAQDALSVPNLEAFPDTEPPGKHMSTNNAARRLEGCVVRIREPDPFNDALKDYAPLFLGLLGCGLLWRELRRLNRSIPAPFLTKSDIKEGGMPHADAPDAAAPSINGNDSIEWRMLLGGASRQGKVRKENQDSCRTDIVADDQGIMIVCDGVGGHPGGRVAAQYASDLLLDRIRMALIVGLDPETAAEEAFRHCSKQMESEEIEGLTTALIVHVYRNRLTWAALGDGRICAIHADGMAQDLLAPHHDRDQPDNVITAWLEAGKHFEPRIGGLRLEDKSLVLAMSDGAGDLLDLENIARHRALYARAMTRQGGQAVADRLLSQLEELTYEDSTVPLHSDNLTLAIAMPMIIEAYEE